jgi:hypothetical protein
MKCSYALCFSDLKQEHLLASRWKTQNKAQNEQLIYVVKRQALRTQSGMRRRNPPGNHCWSDGMRPHICAALKPPKEGAAEKHKLDLERRTLMATKRKHYRVAKKELQPIEENGIYIPEEHKTYAAIAALFLMVLVLVESVLLGYVILSGNDDD